MRVLNDQDRENLKNMKRRILQISFDHKLSHLGSNLTALPILYEIYSIKKDNEKAILSSGHAGLALYTILEHFYGYNAEGLFKQHGVHPNRDQKHRIFASTGSLGQGLPIAYGMALANWQKFGDKRQNVYCLISDGECAEGSIWETLNQTTLLNLHIYVNMNCYGAYSLINSQRLIKQLEERLLKPNLHIRFTDTIAKGWGFPFLKDQGAHYYTLTKEDYELALSML